MLNAVCCRCNSGDDLSNNGLRFVLFVIDPLNYSLESNKGSAINIVYHLLMNRHETHYRRQAIILNSVL